MRDDDAVLAQVMRRLLDKGDVTLDLDGDPARWTMTLHGRIEVSEGEQVVIDRVMHPAPVDNRPHSRACGIYPHEHGTGCSRDCPTCAGRTAGGPA